VTHPPWPVDKVERRLLGDLVGYARNARTHDEAQITSLARLIAELGWTMPILIDERGVIIAGHGRVLAAERLGLAEVPTITARGWSDEQIRLYRIADNQVALGAAWDSDLLRVELEELRQLNADVSLTGFTPDQLMAMLVDGHEPQHAPEPGQMALPAKTGAGSLSERFGVPPFSVLNTREGWWQDRKRAWLQLGIESELGRGGGAPERSDL
jgi:hypothetical protein